LDAQSHNLCAFGALTCPNLTGFQLAKTRGHNFDGISVMSTILVSLRNVIYIVHLLDYSTETDD